MTRQSNITFLVLLFPILTHAQDEFQRFLIGVSFSPDYCYRTLKDNEGSSASATILSSRNELEMAKFGFTTGINVCFGLSQLVGLETGVQYSNKGFQEKMRYLNWPALPSVPIKGKYITDINYLDFPLKVNFTFGKKKFRFCTGAGITTNVFLSKKVIFLKEFSDGHQEEETFESNTDYKAINLSPTVSLGIDYKINDKMKIKIEPTFRYGLLAIANDARVAIYLWNAGANISYYFGW